MRKAYKSSKPHSQAFSSSIFWSHIAREGLERRLKSCPTGQYSDRGRLVTTFAPIYLQKAWGSSSNFVIWIVNTHKVSHHHVETNLNFMRESTKNFHPQRQPLLQFTTCFQYEDPPTNKHGCREKFLIYHQITATVKQLCQLPHFFNLLAW